MVFWIKDPLSGLQTLTTRAACLCSSILCGSLSGPLYATNGWSRWPSSERLTRSLGDSL